MRLQFLLITPVLAACLASLVSAQTPDSQALSPPKEAKEVQATEMRGMPPRATPADYQAQAQVGPVTIAAEFTGHNVPRAEGPLTTEDYVVVEVGFFGPADAHLKLAIEDLSLRINGKKTPLTSQPWGLVAHSLKDPSWIPPEEMEPKEKSKGGISTGGRGGANEPSTPPIIHIPLPLQRAMAQYIQKAAVPQGDRALPQAGLIFFQYRGSTKSIHDVELIYSGPAGNATVGLQP